MNDYERLTEDLQQAINVAETAYYNAQDPDIETLIDEALDKLREAKERAKERAE